ncbi:Csu type fimbrial protein [Sphingomonas jejuensis]|nr:spore coat protein U domain-containing protein [Sphingomonas jejuensis]
MLRILLAALLAVIGGTEARAACSVAPAGSLLFADSSTFDVREAKVAQVSGSGGLTCNGSVLTVISSDYARATATSANGFQLRSSSGVTLPYRLSADSGGTYSFNTTPTINYMNPALLSLLGILSQDSFRTPLFATLTGAGNVPAGVYEDTVTIVWNYTICRGVGALGVCVLAETGSNKTTTITVRVTVTKDCRVAANALEFGSAPLAGQFAPVSQAVLVDCSLGAAYTVSFSAGASGASRPWRAMSSGAGDRLEYNIYRPDGSTIWDEANPAPAAQVGTGAVVPGQVQAFVARINPAQPTPRAGRYTDTVSVVIGF